MLRVKNLSKTYRNSHVRAIDDINLEIEDGDIYGFLVKGYAAPCIGELVTGIENTTVEKNADKFIENGMLYIRHNGVKYNALGVEIK